MAEKRKTKTSAEVKNRYNSKAYDRITLCVPKGRKSIISDYAKAQGKSLNAYITGLIDSDMK